MRGVLGWRVAVCIILPIFFVNYNLLRNIVHEDIYLVATDSGIGLKFN